MSRFQVSVVLVTALAAAELAAAPQQSITGVASEQQTRVVELSAEGRLFVPGTHVPLSEFVAKSTAARTIELHVEPEILAWVAAHAGAVNVALRDGGGAITYAPATSVDGVTGRVRYASQEVGDAVVVSDLLLHEPQVVTHWNAALNPSPTGPRGGQQIGATDGLSTYAYDAAKGDLDEQGSGLKSSDDLWADPLGGGPYYYASDVRAVFADGTGVHDNAAVPAFERYVGETYATHAVTPPAAIWLSDQARAATGFPIAHRNHPDAFDVFAPNGARVEDDLPLFQIVHCHLVDTQDAYPGIPGSENSLGSFILPPGWTSASAPATYPILFNGFYDIHASTFRGVGLSFMRTLDTLYRAASGPRRAVGVLWNGGGAAAAATFQRSAYDNAAQLIADAAALIAADPERVVFTGGSRGGSTALELASNPYGHAYTAKFVNAANPQVRLGQAITTFANPSYALLMASIPGATGYKDAWTLGWEEPVTGKSGEQVVMRNLFGTEDPAVIDAQHSADSDVFRLALLAEGSKIVLRLGSHDYSRPLEQTAHYYDNLVADGVPVQCEIFYGFGHAHTEGTEPDDAALLNKIFDEDDSLDEGIEFYATDPSDPFAYVPITPTHVPLVLEAPLAVGPHQEHTWSAVGEPGAYLEVWIQRLDFDWVPGEPPVFIGAPLLLSGDHLDADPGDVFAAGSIVGNFFGLPAGYWWYEAFYSPDGDTTFETMLGQGHIVTPTLLPDREPVLLLTAVEVPGAADETRTGGLSEDGEFVR